MKAFFKSMLMGFIGLVVSMTVLGLVIRLATYLSKVLD